MDEHESWPPNVSVINVDEEIHHTVDSMQVNVDRRANSNRYTTSWQDLYSSMSMGHWGQGDPPDKERYHTNVQIENGLVTIQPQSDLPEINGSWSSARRPDYYCTGAVTIRCATVSAVCICGNSLPASG